MQQIKVIGITGTIGSGKSLVGQILSDLNYPVIDTDHIVHTLLAENTPVKSAVIKHFGNDIVDKNGSINKSALGSIVFNNSEKRKELEAIIHPAVRIECRNKIEKLQDESIVFVLIPLLFEANLAKEHNEIWVVITDEEIIKERLKQRNGFSEEQIKQRMSAQWPQEKKAAHANYVINNSGTKDNTKSQILELLKKL